MLHCCSKIIGPNALFSPVHFSPTLFWRKSIMQPCGGMRSASLHGSDAVAKIQKKILPFHWLTVICIRHKNSRALRIITGVGKERRVECIQANTKRKRQIQFYPIFYFYIYSSIYPIFKYLPLYKHSNKINIPFSGH